MHRKSAKMQFKFEQGIPWSLRSLMKNVLFLLLLLQVVTSSVIKSPQIFFDVPSHVSMIANRFGIPEFLECADNADLEFFKDFLTVTDKYYMFQVTSHALFEQDRFPESFKCVLNYVYRSFADFTPVERGYVDPKRKFLWQVYSFYKSKKDYKGLLHYTRFMYSGFFAYFMSEASSDEIKAYVNEILLVNWRILIDHFDYLNHHKDSQSQLIAYALMNENCSTDLLDRLWYGKCGFITKHYAVNIVAMVAQGKEMVSIYSKHKYLLGYFSNNKDKKYLELLNNILFLPSMIIEYDLEMMCSGYSDMEIFGIWIAAVVSNREALYKQIFNNYKKLICSKIVDDIHMIYGHMKTKILVTFLELLPSSKHEKYFEDANLGNLITKLRIIGITNDANNNFLLKLDTGNGELNYKTRNVLKEYWLFMFVVDSESLEMFLLDYIANSKDYNSIEAHTNVLHLIAQSEHLRNILKENGITFKCKDFQTIEMLKYSKEELNFIDKYELSVSTLNSITDHAQFKQLEDLCGITIPDYLLRFDLKTEDYFKLREALLFWLKGPQASRIRELRNMEIINLLAREVYDDLFKIFN